VQWFEGLIQASVTCDCSVSKRVGNRLMSCLCVSKKFEPVSAQVNKHTSTPVGWKNSWE
jgi:hypothetical protein